MQPRRVQLDLPTRDRAHVLAVPERPIPIGGPRHRFVERKQRPPAQKRARTRRVEGEERRLVRMVAGVKAPAGAPVPARGERLHQIGNGAEALRIRAEVQGRRRAHGVGRHRLRQHQIARERIEHVLPRPHRLRIAERDRRARLKSLDDIADDAVRRPVPAADDVAGACGRNVTRAREKALPERIGDKLGACLGVAVGIVPAQPVVLDERATGAIVLIDLVARHHDDRTHTRHGTHRLQHVCGSHHVCGVGAKRIKIGRPHQRLGGHVDDDLGLAVCQRARDDRRIRDVAVAIGATAFGTERKQAGIGMRRE
jgi:hypothetical protein